ncbi:MAG: 2-amino-4-hydroxy-6-hydroxymethyldihydropteridine diphosphokinase [Candidatus Kariarchaeaceae archaeon]|jgi:2-amino-4-hydroxy-6-hydroxymethyldihydropteridine diphosphokinase
MSERAIILLGSNIDPREHLKAAIHELRQRLGDLILSKVYESPPVKHKDNDNYLNMAVEINTSLQPQEIRSLLKDIEWQMGRRRSDDKFASREIDLDVVYMERGEYIDDTMTLPDPEIWEYAHVALPVADLLPEFVDPLGRTMKEIITLLRQEATIDEIESDFLG